MRNFRKKIYATAGYNTIYMGPGRPEFDPTRPLRGFEEYLKETAEGSCALLQEGVIDEGYIGSFMSGRFLNQANLPGFLPFMIPSLKGRPCTGIEGACGTGGRTIAIGMRSILSDMAETVFISAFEMQNGMKSVYGADVLAGAGYYKKERKKGLAFFFPGLFSERAGAYALRYDAIAMRQAMATWFEQAILNARHDPKAQEYHNRASDLYALGMTPPNPQQFVPHLNLYDCSKITDGASSLFLLSEKGVKQCGLSADKLVEIIAIGEAEEDITQPPEDQTRFSTTYSAVKKALDQANISIKEIGVLEIHDCFSITAILALEAMGWAAPGRGPQFILEGNTRKEGRIPINPSGGLIGFGHPTGASGVRQMVDLFLQLTHQAANQVLLKTPYGMMISMGGNDKTVTCLIVSTVHNF